MSVSTPPPNDAPVRQRLDLVIDRHARASCTDQLKRQIISKIHFGKIAAPAKLPSVRQLASRLHVNPKTIRKVYHELQAEGYLAIRPRVGVTVKPPVVNSDRLTMHAMRLRFARRSIQEASQLGLSAAQLATLIQRISAPPRMNRTAVTVVECNREQNHWYARQIESALHIRTYEILLDDLDHPKADVLDHITHSRCLVTTHYHWEEVCERAERYGRPVLQLRLNPRVFEAIVRQAQAEPIGLLATDSTFLGGLKRALSTVAPSVREDHILTADIGDPKAARKLLATVKSVFVSPLCAERVAELQPRARVQVLSFKNMIAAESLETLEAALMMDT